MNKTIALLPAVAVATAGLPALAQAAGSAPDLSALTGAVDFSSVAAAILAVGAIGIGMLLAWVSVKYVRKIVRGS